MRRSRLAVVVSAAALIMGMAGFIPAQATTEAPALPTRANIEQTLAAKGVDLSQVVWQAGSRNYAGPNCPGAGWTCTSSSAPVVQQSAAGGGANAADCASPCTVIQTSAGGNNGFRCTQHSKAPDAEQSCDVTQENTTGDNQTDVHQAIEQNGAVAGVQRGEQVALVHQSNGSGDNRLTLKQTINQQANDNAKVGSFSQSQQALQQTAVDQFTTTGDNRAGLDQSQNQHALGKAAVQLTQTQNGLPGPAFGPISDHCYETNGETINAGPNVLAVVCQASNNAPDIDPGGRNDLKISQGLHQEANGTAAMVTQQQSSEDGGAEASLDQHSTGVSTADVDQDEKQALKAPGVANPNQTQYGPLSVPLRFSQDTNPNNTEDIGQKSVQSAGPGAEQFEDLSAGCYSSGNCTIQQEVVQNGVRTQNSDSGSFAQASIFCSPSEGEGGGCNTSAGGGD